MNGIRNQQVLKLCIEAIKIDKINIFSFSLRQDGDKRLKTQF